MNQGHGPWTSNDNTPPPPPPPPPPSSELTRRSAKFSGSPGISKVKEPGNRVIHPSHTTDIDDLLLKKSAMTGSKNRTRRNEPESSRPSSSVVEQKEEEPRAEKTSQMNQPEQTIEEEEAIHPGAQAIAGLGGGSTTASVSMSSFPSIVSDKTHSEQLSKKRHSEQLQTAVLINEEQQDLDEEEKYRIISQAKSDAEAKLKATAVQAEDAEGLELEREAFVSRKRKQIGIAILLVVMLTVGIAVGVIVGTRDPDPDPTAAPSEAPSPAPTPVREIFIPPTFDNTTDVEIVGDEQPPQVLNNACRDAFDLATVIGTPIFGSNENATVDPVDTCEAINRNGRGLWYRMQGDGSRFVASTCDATDFDTQISIYSGVCGRLICQAGNDQFFACGNGDQSKVAWYAEPGIDYLVYVHGHRETSAGIFQLTVASADDNDKCENAQFIESGTLYFGTTRGASVDIVDGCTNEATPGVWFTFIGDGRDRQVVEFFGGSGSNFIGRAFLFRGSDCGNLECLGSGRFEALEGVRHYILVQGTGIVEGDFEIRIVRASSAGGSSDDDDFPCEGAFNVLAGKSVDGNADGNTNVGFGSCGNLVFNTGHGAWFTATGTGRVLTASTCGAFEDFDTQISVFLGSCDNLFCIDGNDQACGDQSSVSWFTEDGVQYLILVHGFGDARGSFTLSVEESNVTSSDECQSAIPITPDGISNLGTTDGASFDNVPICEGLGSSGVGVWYEVRGTGQRLSASTCETTSNQAVKVAVFQGDCSGLECVEGTYTPCGSKGSFTWTTVFDERYYIFVQDPGVDQRMAPVGSFILTLEESSSNDLCENYIGPLLPGGSPTFGSTRSATMGDLDACVVTKPSSRGVFYTVVGTGEELTASVCSVFTNFDAHIQVFVNGCDDLQCMEVINGGVDCNQGTLVRWASVAEELYTLLVTGTDAEEYGNFALTVSSMNDFCVGAYGPLPTNSSTTLGSTFNATVDELFFCGGRVTTYPGVWYYVVGTGSRMTATTCDPSSNFETAIAIFNGTCDNLECVRDTESNPCGLQSAESWNSIEGELYYILVHGSGVGDFGLSVALENYICPSAERIPTGEFTSLFMLTGSTAEAAIADVSVCGLDVQSPGAWYVLKGNGRNILASTCNPGTSFDARLSIFHGNCGGLECVASSDDANFCGDGSDVTFRTFLGEEYYILVHGASSTLSGDFVLHVEEQQHQGCDVAGGPFDLLESSVLVAGSVPPVPDPTEIVDGDGVPCGSSIYFGEGVWLRVEGTGGPIVASTCNGFTHFDTELSVYAGACDVLQCIEGDDNVPSADSTGPDGCFSRTSEVSWSSRQGVTYWVLVHGHLEVFGDGTSTVTFGDFRLSVENGNCPIAEELNMDGSLIVGSTVGKVNANASPCTLEESPGIWYVVKGRGSNIIASTCHEGTVLDTRISVFRGNICDGNLECVETNDDADGCGTQSSVDFIALRRVEYYILVQGAEALSAGNFILSVEESQHQVCTNAAGPTALEIVVDGSLPPSEAVQEVGDRCGSAPNFGVGGYWYYVIGTGRPITASTCHFSTDFDTVLKVYTGNCSLLECVAGNDDACGIESEVSWLSSEGVGYFIQLQGFENSFGNFRLSIDCLQAKGILIGGPNEFGSLDERPNFDVTSCGIDVQSPGASYVVTGRGSNITASTCNEGTHFDTRISIFRGDFCSGDFECIATNDNEEDCGELSTVAFPTTWGVEYYILVQGASEISSSGDFVLSVDENPPERCALVNSPLEIVHPGYVFSGTILPRTSLPDEPGAGFSRCGTATDFFSGIGFWVSVSGTGGSIIASTCNVFTDFDTQLTVYVGTCDTLECVEGFDEVPTCAPGRSEVAWSSRQDAVYYIFVHGYRLSFGEFRLSIESDNCPTAKRLQSSSKVNDSTIGRMNADASACGFTVSSPGAWYVIEGSGRDISTSTCNKNTDFQARVSIFQGDLCDGDLECVRTTSSTEGCDNGSSTTFSTTFGERYYILVHGVDASSAGSFLLSLDENQHDTCATAAGPVNLDDSGLVLVEGMIPDSDFVEAREGRCGSAVDFGGNGFWHSVIGNGGTLLASTCNFHTEFDTQLTVYTGACASLECIAGNDDIPSEDNSSSKNGCRFSRSEVSWSSREGVVYFIFVHGSEGSFGDFRLSMETRRCPLAEELSLPRSFVQGSTSGKTDTYAYACDIDIASAGTWYSIEGRGSNIAASTCNEGTDFDTRISVFQGDICNAFALDCVTTNDDASECGTMSTVNFATLRFERYYILVHGASSSSIGDFVLSIEESLHDSCEDALGPRDFPLSVRTSVGADGSLIENAIPSCGSATKVVGRAFWLSVIGRNERIFASTCSSFSDFDTQLSIFTGVCGNLSCVTGNDDALLKQYASGDDCGTTSKVSWFGEEAVTYHVLVHGFQGDSGSFSLTIDD